jgi:nucleotide-binding universal stress UspA family protein
MTAAMPLLEAAKRVVVLIASEHSDASAYVQYAERLTAELKWHGIEPEIRHLAPGAVPVAEALVDAANKAGADLLVLGGYGHSRAKELVFGGVTRYMLETANFPALIVH